MRAISAFSFEAGTSSFWWRARIALRMRARKSATGSVRLIPSPSSPVRSIYTDREPAGMFQRLAGRNFFVLPLHFPVDSAGSAASTEAPEPAPPARTGKRHQLDL